VLVCVTYHLNSLSSLSTTRSANDEIQFIS